MDYTVFKAKILTKSSIEVAKASLFEILSRSNAANSEENCEQFKHP